MATMAALSVVNALSGIQGVMPRFLQKSDTAERTPELADTPPPMARCLTGCRRTALSNLSSNISIIVRCSEAARSAKLFSMNASSSFTASRRVYRNEVFRPENE